MKRKYLCCFMAVLLLSLMACSNNTVSLEEYQKEVQKNIILQSQAAELFSKEAAERSIEEENRRAYQLGWAYWFEIDDALGVDSTGYSDKYTYGRNYNTSLYDTRRAFYTGYQDACFFVYHREPDVDLDDRVEEKYIEYYPEESESAEGSIPETMDEPESESSGTIESESTSAVESETTIVEKPSESSVNNESETETTDSTVARNDHPLYQLTDRTNLSGLISPLDLVDRSGIKKALPTINKSDLYLGFSGTYLGSAFYVDIQNGFIDRCEKYRYKHTELFSENSTQTANTNVDTLISMGVDGIVLSGKATVVTVQAQTAVNAGVPCDSCSVPDTVMNSTITAVTNSAFNEGYVTGLCVGADLYYPQWRNQSAPVKATVLFGKKDNSDSRSRICGTLTGMIESVSRSNGNPFSFEDAAYLANDYITTLVQNGSLEIPEINMSIVGYGEGQWVPENALYEAENLFIICPDMQVMICENDYMAIGGILAAQAIGVNIGTDCTFFACSEGTMVALEYIRDGQLYCTGISCAYALGWGNVEIFHMVYEEGYDASNMPSQTLIDTIALTRENWAEYFDPSIELVRETTIKFLTTEEKLAQYRL